MTDITIDFEYPVPDEQYAQTDSKNKKGKLRYIGPDKVYIWVDNITNKLSQWESGGTGEELWNGDIPMPTGTGQFLIELDVATYPEIAAVFQGIDHFAIPTIAEEVPGNMLPYYRNKFPTPDHAYEWKEIQYDPIDKKLVKPYPWKQPFITWEDRLGKRDLLLSMSDVNNTADMPDSRRALIVNYRQALRNITETVGVAWTATIPAGGSGYAQDDILLVQDPKYKNGTVVANEVKLTVTTVNGSGAITGFSVENKRALYHPTAAVYTGCFFVTNGAGSGATVTLTKVVQVKPWKTNWPNNPMRPKNVRDTPQALASDSNPDHLVDQNITEDDIMKNSYDTSLPNYIDVSDLDD